MMPRQTAAHFFHVRGRMRETLHARVLDAFAQPVNGLGAGLADRGDVFIRQPKIVALRQRRVRVRDSGKRRDDRRHTDWASRSRAAA